MATTQIELFNLGATTPDTLPLHGAAAVQLGAHAGASLRRGIDLQAGAELDAHFGAEVGDAVKASFSAGADAQVEAALQAAIPLDLFTAAGLVLRLELAAELAAYVGLSVTLEADAFRELVRERVGEGPLADVLEIFLEEVAIGAGVWARAAFAAEAVAEATLTGSLLPVGDQPAGMSFSLRFGAGFGFGTGTQLLTQFGFADPQRLLRRTSDRVTAAVVDAAQAHAATLGAAESRAAREAIGVLRTILPLATKAVFDLGMALTSASSAASAAAAAEAVVGAFVSRAQTVVLEGLADVALGELSDLLGGVELIDRYLALDEAGKTKALDALNGVADALVAVAELEQPEPSELLDALLDCVDALAAVLDLDLIPAAHSPSFQHGLSVFYAAAVLAERIAAFAEGSTEQLFDDGPARTPRSGGVATTIATAIHKPAGAALTLIDVVEYLLDQAPLDELTSASPELAGAVAWIERALGHDGRHTLLRRLLVDLAPPTPAAAADLLSQLGAALGEAVEQTVVPKLLDPLTSSVSADDPLALFVETLVTPTLVALPRVVLPRLPALASDADASERLVEAVSLVLFQSIQHFVLKSIDVLVEHALRDGETAARDLAARALALDDHDPTTAPLAAAAARAALSLTITPQDVARTLTLAADAAHSVNTELRGPLLHSLETLLSFGFSDPATRDAAFATVADTDAVPRPADLETALTELETGALDVIGLIFLGVLEIVGEHFLDEAEAVAGLIYTGAKTVVDAVEAGLEWLASEVDELERQLAELEREAEQATARIAGELAVLADHLRQLVHDAIEAIRAAGWALAKPLVDWAPQEVEDAVHEVYDVLFDGIEYLLETPLRVLGEIADWVRDELLAQAAAGATDPNAVQAAVRNRVFNSSAFDVTIPLDVDVPLLGTVDFGAVTIPHSVVLGAAASTAFGSAAFQTSLASAASAGADLARVNAQKATVRRALDEQETKAQTAAAVASLSTGQPLSVVFDPAAPKLYERELVLRLHVAGANATFVDSVAGVPRRVAVRVNGADYAYDPGQWQAHGDGISLRLRIVAEPPPPPPATLFGRPSPPLVALRLDEYTELSDLRSRLALTSRTPLRRKRAPLPAGLRARGTVTLTMPPPAQRPQPLAVRLAPPATTATVTLIDRAFGSGAATRVAVDGRSPATVSGRAGLNVVQVAVSDGRDREQGTVGAVTRFYLRPGAPGGPADVVIEEVVADPPGPDVAPDGERAVLRSRSSAPVDLSGWRLRDGAGHEFHFPAGTILAPGADLTVWTGRGDGDRWNLHWGRRAAVWNNAGAEHAALLDASGAEVARKVLR